jgi:hypothetical protein
LTLRQKRQYILEGMTVVEHEIKGSVVDRGGIRGANGRLDNLRHVGQRPSGVTFTTIPHACDETSIQSALDYLEKLRESPDSST